MNAAVSRSQHHDLHRPSAPLAVALAIPAELLALFDESAKVKASFHRLSERDRRGFVEYIEGATSSVVRERRAAIIAMSLFGLARDLSDENVGLLR
jgi:uncharacterized protein YdeI (YjbR/CyaY-like superfamily)